MLLLLLLLQMLQMPPKMPRWAKSPHSQRALEQCQQQPQDASVLPNLSLKDAAAPPAWPTVDSSQPLWRVQVPTNRIAHLWAAVPVQSLDWEEVPLLPFYESILLELGYGSLSYHQVQANDHRHFGQMSSSLEGERWTWAES